MRAAKHLTLAALAAVTLMAGASRAATFYQSSFEGTDGGWVASGSGSFAGDWERGVPTTGPGAAFDGQEVWATVLDGNYTDSGEFSFLTQSFDLSNALTAELSWWQWVEIFYDFDTAKLIVNGDTLYERTTRDPTPDYEQQIVDLTPYVGGSVDVTFELFATTVVNRPGWYVDDVKIEGTLVPEPSTFALCGMAGLVGLIGVARRRRRAG